MCDRYFARIRGRKKGSMARGCTSLSTADIAGLGLSTREEQNCGIKTLQSIEFKTIWGITIVAGERGLSTDRDPHPSR